MDQQFFVEPRFSQRQVVEFTAVDNVTLDNWVRYGHVEPDRSGELRMFSARDLIKLDLIHMLMGMFKMQPIVARVVAGPAAEEYVERGMATRDWLDIRDGLELQLQNRGDVQLSFARAADGSLFFPSDETPDADRVDIVLPVRSVARRIFQRVHQAGAGQG